MALGIQEFVAAVGVDPGLLGGVLALKVEAVVTSTSIKFVRDGEVLGICPVDGTAMTMIQNKVELSKEVRETLSNNLLKALKQVLEALGSQAPAASLPAQAVPVKKKVTIPNDKLKSLMTGDAVADKGTEDAAAPLTAVEGVQVLEIFPKELMKSADRVKLSTATKLYQPVKGSSSGSRYFLVAASDDLRIGARYTDGQLSVRVEGKIDSFADNINAAGITKSGPTYHSMHLHVSDDTQAAKALGAILFGLNVKLRPPFPDVKVIKNVGK